MKIAVADDNKQIRERISAIITETQLASSVFTASDGKELCEIIRQHKPEIVITDVIMPSMHGLDSVKHIKSIENYSPTIIVMSELNSEEYINTCFDNGVDYYVEKPADESGLINLINNIKSEMNV